MRAYLSRTSAPTPVLIRAANGFQIILGKVRPITSPGREPSTSSDHCSLPAKYLHVLNPPAHPFPLCVRNGATVEQTWMTLQIAHSGAEIFELDTRHHWLWYADQNETQVDDA